MDDPPAMSWTVLQRTERRGSAKLGQRNTTVAVVFGGEFCYRSTRWHILHFVFPWCPAKSVCRFSCVIVSKNHRGYNCRWNSGV